jgi:hypothetical protein
VSQRENRTTGAPPGRPSKFTVETRTKLTAAVRAGNYVSVACRYAGIGERTFYDWRSYALNLIEQLDTAEDYDAARDALSDEEIEYVQWWEELQQAEDEAEVRLVTQWASQASEDWRAARDLLARRHPDRWKERRADELSGPEGGPIPLAVESEVQIPQVDKIADVLDAIKELGLLDDSGPDADDG